MKLVIYSQRVEVKTHYHERWDCADQRIPLLLKACGYLPIPIPNCPDMAGQYLKSLKPAGIFLTGGNSLVKYGGNAPEKDRMDYALIEEAIQRGIPVYAFCRGMQSVLDYFGCVLQEVDGHVAVRHGVNGCIKGDVNSYHSQAAIHIELPLEILARAEDGVIEAVAYPEKHMIATMWHPEREDPFCEMDIKRVQRLFG